MSSDALKQPLRVCFFVPAFTYGGAQKQCILLLNELRARSDLDLTLIRFGPGPQDHLLRSEGIRVETLDVTSHYDPRALLRALRVVRSVDADVLVSWIRVCEFYSHAIRLLHPQVAWILTQRNSRHAKSLLSRVRDRLGRRADAIVANSVGGAEHWIDRQPRGAVYVVDNMRASVSATAGVREPDSVLFVGRLEEAKNVDTMVRAFVLVAQRRPGATFQICGDGTLRGQLESVVRDADLQSRITFLGFRQDAVEQMVQSRLLVSVSHYEGMPNVLMEGVLAGSTIVASDIAAHRDLLGDDYRYLVVGFTDPDSCAVVIEAALDGEQSSDIAATARARLATMDPETVAERYAEIFHEVAAGRSSQRARHRAVHRLVRGDMRRNHADRT